MELSPQERVWGWGESQVSLCSCFWRKMCLLCQQVRQWQVCVCNSSKFIETQGWIVKFFHLCDFGSLPGSAELRDLAWIAPGHRTALLLLPGSPGINPSTRAEFCAGNHPKTSLICHKSVSSAVRSSSALWLHSCSTKLQISGCWCRSSSGRSSRAQSWILVEFHSSCCVSLLMI